VLLWLSLPADRSLFNHTHILEPREDFVFPVRIGNGLPLRLQADWPYCWVSPRILLTAHFNDNSIMTLKPRLKDLPTGRNLPVTHLTGLGQGSWLSIRSINVSRQSAHIELSGSFQASPDGEWILASSIRTRAMTVIRADDSREIDWRFNGNFESPVWMRDSRHWVGLSRERGEYLVDLFDLDRPNDRSEHILDVQERKEWESPGGIAPTLAGVMPDGRVFAIQWSQPADGQVLTARFLPDGEVEYPRTRRIPIPAGRKAVPLLPPVLSPDGERIAWFISVPRTPLGWPATQRFWAPFKTAPSVQIGLWTTRLDGSDPNEIGVFTRRDPDDRPSLLQWTPDGRNLSFRYQGALFFVPAK
jgi:hypothetical protein